MQVCVPQMRSQGLSTEKTNFKGIKINKSRWGSEPVKTSSLQECNIGHLTVWANVFIKTVALFSIINKMGIQFCSGISQALLQLPAQHLTYLFITKFN